MNTFIKYRQSADSLRAAFGQPTTYEVRGVVVSSWAVTEMVGLAKYESGEMVGFAPLDAGQSTTPESGRIGTKGLPKGWAPASVFVVSSPFGVMFSPRTVGLQGLPNWQGETLFVDKLSTNSPMWEAPPAGAFLSEIAPRSPGLKGLTPRAGEILKYLQEVHGGAGWKLNSAVIGGIQYGMPAELEQMIRGELKEAFAAVRGGGFPREVADLLNHLWVEMPRAAAGDLGVPPRYEVEEVIPPPPVVVTPRQVAMPPTVTAIECAASAKPFADPRPRGIAFASVKTFADVVFPKAPPLIPAVVATPAVTPPPAVTPLLEVATPAVVEVLTEVLYSIRLRGETLKPVGAARKEEEIRYLLEGLPTEEAGEFEVMVSTSPGRWVHPAMAGF